MKTYLLKSAFILAAAVVILFGAVMTTNAQDSPQKSKASKTAKFESVAKTDAAYTAAIDAHDKEAAAKMTDKEGSFKGKVAKLFFPRGGGIVILNFDKDYKTAMTAVLKKSDFSKFPDITQLDGKEIVVSGTFIDYQGNPEIILSDPGQIKIVK